MKACETFITMSEESHDFDLKPNTFSYAVFKTEGTWGNIKEKHEVLMSWEGRREACVCVEVQSGHLFQKPQSV